VVKPNSVFELLVVDNGSTDDTGHMVGSFMGKIKNLRYIYEPIIGLSHARNRGYAEAKYDWVVYIDDDAKAHPDFIERILFTTSNFDFDCIGGWPLAWYLEPRPKWIAVDFGIFPKYLNEVAELPSTADVFGGIVAFRKTALIKIGGFSPSLGMKGNQVGYGEENLVQAEMRKLGYKIGFDPEWKIDHLVAPYKFTLVWHLKRRIAKGKAEKHMTFRVSNVKRARLLARATIYLIYASIGNIPRLFKSDYYIQNYILDTSGYFLRIIGFVF
jgi:glycosyltransferase involved in cell wall biosynthesis